MDNNNGQQEIAVLVAQALEDFRKGMESREKLSIRIGRRTTQIIRFGMAGLSILGLILFYLVFTLTKDFSRITTHMTDMSGYMNSMERQFASVAGNIGEMRQTLLLVNENIGVMPALDSSVRNMDANLAGLNTDLHAMVEQIQYMNGSVAGMTGNIQVMNNQINTMNMTIGNMGENIRQLAKPMKAFPF
jgi:methyl-accepting chemotaxis protein